MAFKFLEIFNNNYCFLFSVIEMGLDYTRLLQDCYPEIWSHVLMVNGNILFDIN